jgi:ribosomal protein S8
MANTIALKTSRERGMISNKQVVSQQGIKPYNNHQEMYRLRIGMDKIPENTQSD